MTTKPSQPDLALSIRQPFAEMILRGTKKIEYRGRPTNVRGVLYLYASKKPVEDDALWRTLKSEPGSLPTGVLVGTVEIVGCREGDDEFEWLLANPVRFARPRTFEGHPQPSFWRPRLR